jgi:DNA-binding winged helix-turn-helix (wHTH) protein
MADVLRFGTYELDTRAGELRTQGRVVRLAPQPFKLLTLLAASAGRLVTRDEIRTALWDGDTFIDFDQSVNFTVKQVREALKDTAERSIYIQTVPKRGYRFIAPVDDGRAPAVHDDGTDGTMTKLLWTNVAELRMLEERRRARARTGVIAAAITGAVLLLTAVILWVVR